MDGKYTSEKGEMILIQSKKLSTNPFVSTKLNACLNYPQMVSSM